MKVTKIKMLRLMSEHIKKDTIRNDCIWEKVGVAPIEEKMIEI